MARPMPAAQVHRWRDELVNARLGRMLADA